MAMYYYARRLTKASKKNKTIHRDPISLPCNGSVPSYTPSSQVVSVPKMSDIVVTSPPPSSSHPPAPPPRAGIGGVGARVTKGSSNVQVWEGSGGLECSSHLGKAVNHHVTTGSLVFKEGNLYSGTLEGLIDYLTPSENHMPDKAFLFAFILTSRIFIRPYHLLATVMHGAFLEKNEQESQKVVPNLVQVLKEWTQIFPYDFRDDDGLMMANVRAITHKCITICPQVKKEVSVLLTTLLDKLTLLEKFENTLSKINLEVEIMAGASIRAQGGERKEGVVEGAKPCSLCPSPHTLAQQLIIVELERFSFIGAQEFIQAFLKESSPSASTSPPSNNPTDNCSSVVATKGKKLSRVESYVNWFHRLSFCVATDICKTARKKERVKCLEYWAQVSCECVTLGNFNSAMSILTGLNLKPVQRLSKTWTKFQAQEFLQLVENLFNPGNNFDNYRKKLKQSSCYESGPVPFFSLLIKDLFFLKEAVSGSRLPNGHLHFSNMLHLGTTVGEIMSWQKNLGTCVTRLPHLLQLVQTMPALPEWEAPNTPEESCELDRLLSEPHPQEQELNSSFQSIQLIPSTSSGSTSGVHEDDSVGISPTEIHKLIQFRFNPTIVTLPNQFSANFNGVKETVEGEVQVHSIPKLKSKPPVPL